MPRREFPSSVKRAAYERSQGICECHRVPSLPTYRTGCGCVLGAGNTYYEHVHPDGAGGDNDLNNCAVLTKTCWRIKTDSYDRPTVAKVVRQFKRDKGIFKTQYRPLPGTKRSGISLPFRGGPVDRKTGRPWGT